MHNLRELKGVIPPMITPFAEDDGIDTRLLAEEAQYLKGAGVDGLVVAGSTGEGAGMCPEEVAECVEGVIGAVENSIPVLAGVIADTCAEAVLIATRAAKAGAAGLQVPPPSYRTSTDVRVLSAYYRAITSATGLPLIIYNVIPWAQVAIAALDDMVSENPLIIGIKQSGRNFHALADLLANRRVGMQIYSAIDDMLYPSFMLGVDGTISGTASVFPGPTIELRDAVNRRDFARALELHNAIAPVWRCMDGPEFPSRIKCAMALMGRKVGRPRRPFDWPTRAVADRIRNALDAGRLLGDQSTPAPAAIAD